MLAATWEGKSMSGFHALMHTAAARAKRNCNRRIRTQQHGWEDDPGPKTRLAEVTLWHVCWANGAALRPRVKSAEILGLEGKKLMRLVALAICGQRTTEG